MHIIIIADVETWIIQGGRFMEYTKDVIFKVQYGKKQTESVKLREEKSNKKDMEEN